MKFDILDKYNVKATFFVTNQFSNYQHLLKRIKLINNDYIIRMKARCSV